MWGEKRRKRIDETRNLEIVETCAVRHNLHEIHNNTREGREVMLRTVRMRWALLALGSMLLGVGGREARADVSVTFTTPSTLPVTMSRI